MKAILNFNLFQVQVATLKVLKMALSEKEKKEDF